MKKVNEIALPVAFVCLAAWVTLLTVTGRVEAQQSDASLAETHFKAASAYYHQGKYEKALEGFKEAYRIMPLPEVRYNMAQCYERLGHLQLAIDNYKKYLEEKPDTKDLQAIRDKISVLEEKLGKTGILVTVSQDGANIFVDGHEVGVSPLEEMVKVAPGDHELRVEKPGFQTFTMKFTVAAGLSHSVTVDLTPAVKEHPKTVEGKKEPAKEAKKGKMVGYYVGYAVSGALLLGGAATGSLALVEVNKANDSLKAGDLDTRDDHEKRGRTYGYVTDALLAAGAAGIVITTVVLVVKKPWKEKESKKETVVAPAVGPRFAGFAVVSSF